MGQLNRAAWGVVLAAGLAIAGAARPWPAGRVFISPAGEPFRPTAPAPDPFETWFARADSNHDGRLDREEFRADARAFFQTLDTNRDGVVDGFEVGAYERATAPELATAEEQGGGAALLLGDPEPVSGADLDLDSRVTGPEWIAAADHRFDLLDIKRAGSLDRAGLAALVPKPGKRRRP